MPAQFYLPGSFMYALAASHKVLTITRMLLPSWGTGGQNQKHTPAAATSNGTSRSPPDPAARDCQCS